MSNEKRWLQRLKNFNKAFTRLEKACEQEKYSDLERAGLVQTYEFTFELAWNTLKDKLEFEGYDVKSAREAIKQAFKMELISSVDTWLKALESRNLLSHAYDDQMAEEAVELIKETFYPMLIGCISDLNKLAKNV